MKNLTLSRLSDNRLSRVAKDLLAMLQPAIRLKTFSCREDELPLGSTRVGGRPDLADDVVWPSWNGKPLVFLAQINLGDLAKFPFASVLPREGWLVFFYEAEQSTWGYDPKDKGSWAVIFMPDAKARLERRGLPSDILQNGFYNLCKVQTHEIVTAMPWESPAIDRLQLSADERDAYFELLDEVYGEGEVCHQILGHPQPIQGDMQLECQLVSNGLYCGDSTGYNDPRAKELAKGAEDWKLLFQLDTDDNAGMMWGDAGRLYFWIRQEDLNNRDFGKSWMVLQCF